MKTQTQIKQIDARLARQLRHKILRPHQPPEACIYPNDDAANTAHFGAFENSVLIGIASIFNELPPHGENQSAWRIRGMATEAAARGKGYGGLLLNACIKYAASQNGSYIWCNARTTVMGFYEKFGFKTTGEEFELPGIGPHYLMIRLLSNEDY